MQNHRLTRSDLIALGTMAFLFGLLLIPALAAQVAISRARELSNRTYCTANMRGIISSMATYGNDGDMYPLLTATSPTNYVATFKPEAEKTTADDVVKSLYADNLQPNNPLGGMWLMVLKNYVTPKQFICKSDPYITSAAVTSLKDSGKMYDNFQDGGNVSYSVAYPWSADKDGKVKPGVQWHADRTDSSQPLVSDMAPYLSKKAKADEILTKPVATAPATQEENVVVMGHGENELPLERTNSGNHQFQGQVVGYGDAHAEFVRQPDIGQNNDNIWTEKVANTETVIDAGALPTALTADSSPLDIVMVPTRSAKGELK